MHELRGNVESVALAEPPIWRTSMAVIRAQAIRELRELIAALDRRVPQVHRAGEVSIARDTAALKARALTRIDELERESRSGATPPPNKEEV